MGLSKLKNIPRRVIFGLVGVALMYVGVAGLDSVVTPWWLGKGDAPRHIDYALSIYHFEIPRFNDPLQYPVFNELAQGKYRNQPAAVNPPLFYVLHAPLVGPLLDSGHWQAGIALGRAFNIFLGVLCIAVLAWAGWLFGGRRKEIFAVSVPAISVMTFNFTTLNQNYALDVLLVLFATLAFIFCYKILQKGLEKNYLFVLGLLSLLGMATKASYIVILAVSLLAIVLSALIHEKSTILKRLIKGSMIAGLILMTIVLTVGWYYYFQNYRVSGDWASAAPSNFGSTSRPYKPFSEVITSSNLWGMFYERIAANEVIAKLISGLALLGLAFLGLRTRLNGLRKNKVNLTIFLLMTLASAGILATQIVHAVGYGGYYFRYFLPVILPLGLVLSYGLLEFRRLRGQLVAMAAAAMGGTTILAVVGTPGYRERLPSISETGATIDRVYLAAANNNVHETVPTILLGCFVIGTALLAISLWQLSGRKRTHH